jgi:hypothetical protein
MTLLEVLVVDSSAETFNFFWTFLPALLNTFMTGIDFFGAISKTE